MLKVIYDFGANNGDDIPYYLLKGDRVVAVEANPVLVSEIRTRFQREISDGRLFVESCVVTDYCESRIPFYVHRTDHVLSRMDKPESLKDYETVDLDARSAVDIIAEYGEPYFIKLDIEGADKIILRSILDHDIKPPYISVECHDIEVLMLLVVSGGYSAFKYVLGSSVVNRFKNVTVTDTNGSVSLCSFPYNSAGPFGNDIDGDWWNMYQFTRKLCLVGTGWIDVHASLCDRPNDAVYPDVTDHLGQYVSLRNLVRYCVNELWYRIRRQKS